jgi:hypothetical protein
MIDSNVMDSFFTSMREKTAAPPAPPKGLSKGVKTLLGLTAAGGVATGVVGEQAKDDIIMGRRMRKQQGLP